MRRKIVEEILKENKEICLMAIDRRIEKYSREKNPESRINQWYMLTGYIEGLFDAGILTCEEYRDFCDMLE